MSPVRNSVRSTLMWATAFSLIALLGAVFARSGITQVIDRDARRAAAVVGLSDVVRLGSHDGKSYHPRWSHDGQELYFTSCPGERSARCELWKSDADGGNPSLVVRGAWAGVPSPDGRRLAYVKQGDLTVFDIQSGQEYSLGEQVARVDLWLPDGKRLLVVKFESMVRSDERVGLALSRPHRTYGLMDLDSLKLSEVNGHQVWTRHFYRRNLDLSVVLARPEVETVVGSPHGVGVDLPDGLWAASLNGTFLQFLGPESDPFETVVSEVLVSRDGERVAWESSEGSAFVARVRRGTLPFFKVALGSERGVRSGDVFYVRPARVNPLTGSIVGYLEQPTKGVVSVTDIGADGALLTPVIEVSGIAEGDIAVLTRATAWERRVVPDSWGQLVLVESPTAYVLSLEPPALSDKIVFVSNRGGDFDIYTMNPDGTDVTDLSRARGQDGDVDISPDGRRVAFGSARDGNWNVYVMNADGSNLRNLTISSPADDMEPTWSPDGRRLAFMSMRDGNLNIYAINEDGSGLRRLTGSRAHDGSPAWSPDGRRIAFVSVRDGNHEIYVMNQDGSDVKRLTHHRAPDQDPAWSPDGTKIAFDTFRDGNAEVYVMNSDGSGLRNLTNNAAEDFQPSWSPDGRKIVFGSNRDRNYEIYVMSSVGTAVTRLTRNSAHDAAPVWSRARR